MTLFSLGQDTNFFRIDCGSNFIQASAWRNVFSRQIFLYL